MTTALTAALAFTCLSLAADPFDAAPFARPLPDGPGLVWDDPREIHRVVAHFPTDAPDPASLRLEYWGSRWPAQHLPKDRQPGGGDTGWMELGDWHRYGWRTADADAARDGRTVTFRFRPVNAREFPKLTGYPAPFRYTLKLRLTGPGAASIARLQAFTDSTQRDRTVRLTWREPPIDAPRAEAFNGRVLSLQRLPTGDYRLRLVTTANPDPNTFDRTLVTVRRGPDTFTFAVDDLAAGPIFVPHLGACVLEDADERTYTQVAASLDSRRGQSLYDRVAALPEQTWPAAWAGMPPKKSPIVYPLGLDGGRQRFRLDPDGGFHYRTNDGYLTARPGRDTPRLKLEPPERHVSFGLSNRPTDRTLLDSVLPICQTTWDHDGVRVTQTAFVTPLESTQAGSPPPAGDTTTVLVARFTLTNPSDKPRTARLPLSCARGTSLRRDDRGRLWLGDSLRARVLTDGAPADPLAWTWTLPPGGSGSLTILWPYVVLAGPDEPAALDRLDPAREQNAVAAWWRDRLATGARLATPEPMLNDFYRAHASHLLINCEREPGSSRRFARVGSFGYGAYGNESCMMVADLHRRGLFPEARACLDASLHYQGTAPLPGNFSDKQGVLYGAGGYEAGGYNQHHGWILWALADHYRFTRDDAWLQQAAPGIRAAADWIVRQRARTAARPEPERGLLPAGSLEDIGDWWPWLSTNCYTWRGLDAAAWALAQASHPDAPRLRREADDYRAAILRNFRAARDRAPVVRLRDGTCVPHIPSHPYRRGRCFGWICETLEGALHLLIAGLIDPRSPEAAWILKDYEDNLYLSHQYGYTLDDFDRHWFGRGGMSMQACLLLHVEPYLARDDVKHALRGLFNAQAASYFPDVRLNTEHALPELGSWRGDHFKSSDEANAAGWLRYLFLREDGDTLLVGQAVPRAWLADGRTCGLEHAATWFGPASITFTAGPGILTARLTGPTRNPPARIRLRFRDPRERSLAAVTVNGRPWTDFQADWVTLPGTIGQADIVARFQD